MMEVSEELESGQQVHPFRALSPVERFRAYAIRHGSGRACVRALRELASKVLPRPIVDCARLVRATDPLAARVCPICGFAGYFGWSGCPPRRDAICPKCGSLERHRLFALAVQTGIVCSKWLSESRAIHFAPEPSLVEFLRCRTREYETAEPRPGADIVLNIESIALKDDCVDLIVANHVLEHVDDRRAAKEVLRILKSGGRFLVSVPVVEGWEKTYEDAALNSSRMQELHFGQHDHKRLYGRDFAMRIQQCGFDTVSEFTACGSDAARYSLRPGEKIYCFLKR